MLIKTHLNKKKSSHKVDAIPAHLAPAYILKRNRPDKTDDLIPEAEVIENRIFSPSEVVIRENLYKALNKNQIDIFVQPVVTLPQRKSAFYEILGRLRISSGDYLPAQNYLNLARKEKLSDRLDTLIFMESLDVIRYARDKGAQDMRCFINVRPSFLRHHDYMSILLGIFKNHRDVAHRIIFEMPMRDYIDLSSQEQKVINGLSQIGCRFSADNLSDMPTDIALLRARNISIVKVPANILVRESKDDQAFSSLLRKKSNLDSFGIDIVAEQIENEEDLLCILDYDIPYGQGFLFGKPDFKGVYTG